MTINRQALQRSQRISFLLGAAALFLYLHSSTIGLSQEYFCRVINVDQNAWINRRNETVKSSLLTGDYVFKGDRIFITKGNSLNIALDNKSLNIINIEGEATFEIVSLFPTVLDLKKGQVLSLLDNKTSDRRYKVITPNSISTVRGTQFLVRIDGIQTEVITYHGLVQVSGRDPSTGRETPDYVILAPNQKTYLETPGTGPERVDFADNKDLAEFDYRVSGIDHAKKARLELELALGPIVPRTSILVQNQLLGKEKFFDKKQNKSDYGTVII